MSRIDTLHLAGSREPVKGFEWSIEVLGFVCRDDLHWIWGDPLGGFGSGPVKKNERLELDGGHEHRKKRVV